MWFLLLFKVTLAFDISVVLKVAMVYTCVSEQTRWCVVRKREVVDLDTSVHDTFSPSVLSEQDALR